MRRAILVGILISAGLAAYVFSKRAPVPSPSSSPAAVSEYVDPSECASCHADVAETYQRTGMGRSFFRPMAANMREDFKTKNTFYHAASDRYYTLVERDGRYFQRRHQLGPDGKPANIMEDEIQYVLGSGNHARTYLHETEQKKLVELPIAWYAAQGGYWGMNPGYDWKHHSDFRRKITLECVFCHNGYPASKSDSDRADMEAVFPSGVPEGIDCQRCHGPGGAHVRAPQAANIVNPAKLSRDRNLEVCMQCHLETTSAPLPYAVRRVGRGVFSYKPGELLSDYAIHFDHAPGTGHDDKFEIAGAAYRLRKSLCFQKSGTMSCTTCHNPHDVPRGEAANSHYVSVCKSCHEDMEKLVAARRHPASNDCLGCHMPVRRTDDVVHAVMTDHYIQRRKPSRDLLAPLAEDHGPHANEYKGEVVVYYPPPASLQDPELYTAVAQVMAKANVADGIRRLDTAIRQSATPNGEFYYELAKALADDGAHDRAIPMFEETLRRLPDYWPALHRLGLSLMRVQRFDRAVEVMSKAASLSSEGTVHNELGLLYRRMGRIPEAQAALKRAIEVDPRFAPAHNNLAGMLLDAGDINGAEAEFREAIRLQPDLAASHASLAHVLMNRSRFAEAEFHFERAIREAEPGDAAFADAHLSLGGIKELQGKLDDAARNYRAVLAVVPDDPKANYSLGALLVMQGRFAAALPHLQKAAQSPDPKIRESARETLRRLRR
jgi:predicted CXXCH cytochrome family protein